MADNVFYTDPGAGARIGVDSCTVNAVANTGVPLGKIGFGGNDVWTYVTSTVGLPVNLAQVGGSAFALGQQLAAASVPVVLTAAQLTALTPLSTVNVGNFPAGFLAAQSGTWNVGITGSVAVTGTFWQATQPVSLASLPALAAGTAVIGHVIVDTAPTTAVTGTFWQATQPVSIATLPALAAGSAVIGHVIVDTAPTTAVTQSGTWNVATVTTVTTVSAVTAISNALPAGTNTLGSVGLAATTSGGATPYRYIAAASANQDSQSVKASAGQLFSVAIGSVAAAVRFLKLYDKASAPTSADTPVQTLVIPGATTGAGSNVVFVIPISFASGIGFRITTAMADADTGAATAGDVCVSLGYK